MYPRLHLDYFEPGSWSHGSSEDSSDIRISSSYCRNHFVDYLTHTFCVSPVPRLVENDAPSACQFTLSEDFRGLFQRYQVSHIFQLVLDKWESYSPWMELDELHRHCEECLTSRASMLRDFRGLPSQIEHETHTQVLDTVLADIDPLIQNSCGKLATLQVRDSADEIVRSKLHCLGVTTRKGSEFYLKCLRAIRSQTCPSEEHVDYLYEQIQVYYEEDKDEIEYVTDGT